MSIYSFFLGSGTSWTPAKLFANSEVGLWIDPSDLSTMWQDSAKTTTVAADGDPVGYIADKSGNGFYFEQGTSSQRPTYRTDGTLHWLDFDGVDDYLSGGKSGVAAILSDVATDSEYEAVVGCRFETITTDSTGYNNSGWFGDYGGYVGVAMAYNIASAGDKLVAYNWDGDGDYVEIGTSLNTNIVASQRHDNGNLYLSKDGGSYSSIATGATSVMTNTLSIPYYYSLLADGRFYGLIFRKTLFSADRTSAITWMGTKTGQTI